MPGHRQRALARLWNVGAGFSRAWGAMMCPSVAPMVALYSRIIRERSPVSPLFSTAGHLVTREGLLTFAIALAGTASPPMGSRGITQGGGSPARRSSARWSTSAAAKGRLPREVPQPAPSRARLLARPLGRRAGDGRQERCLMRRVWLGARGREDCPWRRIATYGAAAILFALGVLLLAVPDAIPAPLGGPSSVQTHGLRSGIPSASEPNAPPSGQSDRIG